MLPAQIIQKKRDNQTLSASEIKFFIEELVQGTISDSQSGAFLMAAYLNGLSPAEIAALTEAMTNSGQMLNYPKINKPIADKHSTGGVGDKISLLLLPICTACGLAIPMISGRGLAHTGGTLDKLESIIGFNINLNQSMIDNSMKYLGGFIIGQSESIAPADKLLYQIRDVTATVDSIGLITASILSKKLAEGLDVLVLDLKVGAAAFMRTIDEANALAQTMKATSEKLGLKMKIVFSSMDSPLGRSAGNWLEMLETEESLKNNFAPDIKELTYKLASEMLISSGIASSYTDAEKLISNSINSGQALENFYQFIKQQGGDWDASAIMYSGTKYYEEKSKHEGYVHSIDALKFGKAAIIIGAGRKIETDKIDHASGFIFEKKCGDKVKIGDTLYKIYYTDNAKLEIASDFLKDSYSISLELPKAQNLIIDAL